MKGVVEASVQFDLSYTLCPAVVLHQGQLCPPGGIWPCLKSWSPLGKVLLLSPNG